MINNIGPWEGRHDVFYLKLYFINVTPIPLWRGSASYTERSFDPLKNHPSESLTIYLCQTTTTTTVGRDKQGREEKKMGGGEGERQRQKSRPYDISKW